MVVSHTELEKHVAAVDPAAAASLPSIDQAKAYWPAVRTILQGVTAILPGKYGAIVGLFVKAADAVFG